jgi:hypothetical protein
MVDSKKIFIPYTCCFYPMVFGKNLILYFMQV